MHIFYLKHFDVYTFCQGGGGSEKVYHVYAHLNVDNYGRIVDGFLPIFTLNVR